MSFLKKACDTISNVLTSTRQAFTPIPAILIAYGAICRPGLSPKLIAANIIRRMSEAGAINNEYTHVTEAMERIRVEEILNGIMNDMVIESAIAPGMIQITNADGSVGVNPGPIKLYGVAR